VCVLRHHALVGSVSRNPVNKGENMFTYTSGARTDDDVSYSSLKRTFKENTYFGYYEMERLSKKQWEEEKRFASFFFFLI
jgi:hypothetical protein